MKTLIITLVLSVATSFPVNSQTIREFFVPNSPMNKSTFYIPGKTGQQTESSRVIYYIDSDKSLDLMDVQLFRGEPTVITTKTVTFSETEVSMIKSIFTGLIETNEQRIHEPAIILLKMPPIGQSVKWTYKESSGDVITCLATWTTTSIDGEELATIKVEQEVEGFGPTAVEYYVRSIGLYQTNLRTKEGGLGG